MSYGLVLHLDQSIEFLEMKSKKLEEEEEQLSFRCNTVDGVNGYMRLSIQWCQSVMVIVYVYIYTHVHTYLSVAPPHGRKGHCS